MRRFPPWLWGVLAVVFGIAAMLMARSWLAQQKPPEEAIKMAWVVVATRDIDAARILTPDMLSVRQWPQDKIPVGAFKGIDDLKDRVTTSGFKLEDAIVEAKLAPPGMGLTALVAPGKRAMTVRVDEASGVAGFITPGNLVDVVVTFSGGEADKEPVSKVVLEKLKILATGQRIETRAGEKPQVVPTVTFEVTPEEGEALAMATRQGGISLVLRSLKDDATVVTRGVRASQLLRGHLLGGPGLIKEEPPERITAMEPQRPAVEVVRRLKREAVSF